MTRRVNTQYFALVLFFTLCQVIGAVCALPDLSIAEGATLLVEEGMACPMDGTSMCPPAATSSPERQVRNGAAIDLDHGPILLSSTAALIASSVPTQWSKSSACSIVPISIGSSSVLRI